MKFVFADTHFFLRFLTQDDEGHGARAERHFRAAAHAIATFNVADFKRPGMELHRL